VCFGLEEVCWTCHCGGSSEGVGSILGSGFFFCVEAGYCILVGLRWVRRSAVGRIWTVGFEIGLIWLKDRFVCKADEDTSGMRWMRIYSKQVK